MKIDVEGSVKDVFTGMTKTIKTSRPDIVIEVLHDADLANYLTAFLKEFDYNFIEIKEDSRHIQQTHVVTSGTGLLDLNRLVTTKTSQECRYCLTGMGVLCKNYMFLDCIEK